MTEDTVTNERGGKQARLECDLSLLPPKALLQIGEVLYSGAQKYGVDNWRKIERREHINHAIVHLYKHLSGDTSEAHMLNAACRIMFAIETERSLEKPQESI